MTEKKKPFYTKKSFIILSIFIVLIGGILLWSRLSPAPGAAIIRLVFDKGASNKRVEMEKVVGTISDAQLRHDIRYINDDKDALLDIYIPDGASDSETGLPIVIWTHGGA